MCLHVEPHAFVREVPEVTGLGEKCSRGRECFLPGGRRGVVLPGHAASQHDVVRCRSPGLTDPDDRWAIRQPLSCPNREARRDSVATWTGRARCSPTSHTHTNRGETGEVQQST